jgi:two-component system, NarL family, sensor kinase
MTKEIEIPIIFTAGAILFALLSLTIIFFFIYYQKTLAKQQMEHQIDLLKKTIETQELERKRFSEDLHDDLGANLSVLKMKLANLEKEKSQEVFLEVKALLERVITDTRKVSRALSPVILERYGLAKAINEFITRANTNNDILIVFTDKSTHNFRDKNIELSFFRIFQELLNNAIKHSKGDKIEIELIISKLKIELLFIDNGIAFNINEKMKFGSSVGLGLKNVQSRIMAIEGALLYNRAPTSKNIYRVVKEFKL